MGPQEHGVALAPPGDKAVMLRSEVERALDELVSFEEGSRFQSLAVILAKKRWPELVASERKKDLGLDAYAHGSGGSLTKGLACSITATLNKVKTDATKVSKNEPGFETLIFCTSEKVTNQTVTKWAKEIKREFGYKLIVVPREDIITSLMDPANESLCRTHLGVSALPSEMMRSKLEAARQACHEESSRRLRHPRLRGTPLMRLGLSKGNGPSGDASKPVDLETLQHELSLGARLVLEGPPGAGKTTTLAQLAGLGACADGLCLVVDFPGWISSHCSVLDFVARLRSFRSLAVGPDDLTQLSRTHHFDFLLNGWNEVPESDSAAACQRLADLDREYPEAGILVATRGHFVKPPLHGASRIRVHQVSRDQRIDYVTQVLSARASELLTTIDSDPTLDRLTRTPLILHEVTRLFEVGRPTPTTKLDILRAVVLRIEASEEHNARLQTPPLHGHAESFLSALAFSMTQMAQINIPGADARECVSTEAEALQKAGQLAARPEPPSVLTALTAHHVLERLELGDAYRFQHQQFQEFYAALEMVRILKELVSDRQPDSVKDFQAHYVDQPKWGESLEMVAEAVGASSPVFGAGADSVSIGECLVRWAIPVEPVFAATLSRLCGLEVWTRVSHELGELLRRWYALPDQHHQRCALAGMLASGSPDFSDIIIPLLSNDNQQTRLQTYRAFADLHFSSLGPDWRTVVDRWGEEPRMDFLHAVVDRSRNLDVAEDFARTDPSIRVRAVALQVMAWSGAGDALRRACEEDNGSEALVEMLRSDPSIRDIPAGVHAEVVVALRDLLKDTKDAARRLALLVMAHGAGDPDALDGIKVALEVPGASGLGGPFLASVLEAVEEVDRSWVNRWVSERIADGLLPADRWIGRVTEADSLLLDQALERICTEGTGRRQAEGASMLLARAADGRTAEAICRRLYDLEGRSANLNPGCRDPALVNMLRQLENTARALPPMVLASAVISTLSKPGTLVELRAVLRVLGRADHEGPSLREQLPEANRQSLRDLLVEMVPLVLEQNDFYGETKASLAMALGRVGDATNVENLQRLRLAEVERVRRGRQARRRGEQGDMANGASTSWDNWHVEALTWLGVDAAEPVLLGLLAEPDYEKWAAAALARLAGFVPASQARSWMLATAARDERSPDASVDEERRARYAAAITARLQAVLALRSNSETQDSSNGRARELAGILAYMDGKASMDLVMRVMLLPDTWGGWQQTEALEHLLSFSARLPTDGVLNALNPVVERIMEHGPHDEQYGYLLERCLCLFAFVDDPARGASRIKEVVSSAALPAHRLRGVVAALGRSGAEESLDLLIDIAQSVDISLGGIGQEWFAAVAAIDNPRSRRLLVSFVDREVNELGIGVPPRLRDLISSHIAALADRDRGLRDQILELCRGDRNPFQREALADVIARLDSPEAALAGVHLIDDRLAPTVPVELVLMLERLLVGNRPYGASGWARMKPRSGAQIRRRLLEFVVGDHGRCRTALQLLGLIESWRLDFGKPTSEPRHPALDTRHPWPPLELPSAQAASHSGKDDSCAP